MSIWEGISNKIQQIIGEYPFASTSIAILSLVIVLLRKIHGKFVVYPQVGGRHNHENYHGYRHPREKSLNSEDIQIESEKNIKLRGWYIKHAHPQKLVIYFHQNAGNIGGRLYYSNKIINDSKVNVLLVAYRGFSDSDGNWKPSESEIMKDAVAIFRKGVQLAQRDKLPLFVFGRSLGGAAAIHTLSRQQFKYSAKGLILENTFTSICDVVYNFLPPLLYPLRAILWLVTSNSYRSISKIKNIHVPILFIKGRRDTLVPAKLMDALQAQFSRYKGQHFTLEVENGAHNNTWNMAGQKYFETLNEFMNNCSKL